MLTGRLYCSGQLLDLLTFCRREHATMHQDEDERLEGKHDNVKSVLLEVIGAAPDPETFFSPSGTASTFTEVRQIQQPPSERLSLVWSRQSSMRPRRHANRVLWSGVQ